MKGKHPRPHLATSSIGTSQVAEPKGHTLCVGGRFGLKLMMRKKGQIVAEGNKATPWVLQKGKSNIVLVPRKRLKICSLSYESTSCLFKESRSRVGGQSQEVRTVLANLWNTREEEM